MEVSKLQVYGQELAIKDEIARKKLENMNLEGYDSPFDYGAKGDNVTDDTYAFEKMIGSGKCHLIPQKKYKLTKMFPPTGVACDRGEYRKGTGIYRQKYLKKDFTPYGLNVEYYADWGLSQSDDISGMAITENGTCAYISRHGQFFTVKSDFVTKIRKVADLSTTHANDMTSMDNYFYIVTGDMNKIMKYDGSSGSGTWVNLPHIKELITCCSYDRDREVFYFMSHNSGGSYNFFMYDKTLTREIFSFSVPYEAIPTNTTQGSEVIDGTFTVLASGERSGTTLYEVDFARCEINPVNTLHTLRGESESMAWDKSTNCLHVNHSNDNTTFTDYMYKDSNDYVSPVEYVKVYLWNNAGFCGNGTDRKKPLRYVISVLQLSAWLATATVLVETIADYVDTKHEIDIIPEIGGTIDFDNSKFSEKVKFACKGNVKNGHYVFQGLKFYSNDNESIYFHNCTVDIDKCEFYNVSNAGDSQLNFNRSNVKIINSSKLNTMGGHGFYSHGCLISALNYGYGAGENKGYLGKIDNTVVLTTEPADISSGNYEKYSTGKAVVISGA